VKYGIFISIASSEIVEICARSGFDFCILDGEHGRICDQDLVPLVACAKSANPEFKVYFRLPELSTAAVTHALDSGLDGIVAPQVSSVDDARKLIKAAKFYPLGMRGVHPGVRAAHYGFRSAGDYLSQANSEISLIIQIESKEAYEQLDGILELEGIDMLFPGPFDLSQSLGLVGQVNHPEVETIMRGVAEKARNKGVGLGTFATTPEAVELYQSLGFSLMAVSGDLSMVGLAMKATAMAFRKS
jgi:4-hydroxy-2-oxoheptanedioate aldolase